MNAAGNEIHTGGEATSSPPVLSEMGDDNVDQVAVDLAMSMEVERGSLEYVKRCVEAGASVNGTPRTVPRPLEIAANKGYTDIIRYLVEKGADIEITSQEQSSNQEQSSKGVVELVVNPEIGMMIPPPGSRPLHGACYGGSPDACDVLLELGADPNSTDVAGCTPFMVACDHIEGDTCLDLAKRLVPAGADLTLQDGEGRSALHIAATRGETDVAKMLLSAAPTALNLSDKRGNTALANAASNGQGTTVSFLLSAGANEEAAWKKTGFTALLAAIHGGQNSVVSILLDEGFDAIGGELAIPEAMRYAVEYERLGILQMLLDVQGEENRATWANHLVWSAPTFLGIAPDLPRGHQLLLMTAVFGVPMIHCAAEHSSLRSVHVLLSAGADERAPGYKGACVKDRIGFFVSQDKRDPQTMAAVARMLARGPAFRARSWAWPSALTSPQLKAPRLGIRFHRPSTSRKVFSRGFTRLAELCRMLMVCSPRWPVTKMCFYPPTPFVNRDTVRW